MSEMQAIFQNHDVVENWDADIEVLHSISTAFQNRDLSELNKLLQTISFYGKKHECFLHAQNPTFFGDEVIQFHMNYLRNELMEQNFLKIVEPYNVVEIQFVAEKMDLPVDEVYYENSQLFIDCKEIVADDSGQKTPSQFR